MRIVHILRKYDPAEWGGTETAILQLTSGLSAHGVESAVYAPAVVRKGQAPADPLAQSGCDVRRFRACLPVLGMPRARRDQLVAVGGNLVSWDLVGALWRDHRAAVVHTHVLGRLGAVGLRIARRRRIPFVASIHGGVYDLPEAVHQTMAGKRQPGLDWGKAVGWLLRARTMLGEADAIVTCNPREAEKVAAHHPGTRVIVQPHGVPAARFAVDHREAAEAAFPQLRGRRVLLLPGRLDPVKNQDWVLAQTAELAARHPGLLVVCAGPVTDAAYGEQLRQRIESERLGGHVFLAGKLPPGDPRLIGLMQRAEAVVLPSVSETFGLVILESWAAGTPVISSRTSGAVSLLQPGQDGWLFDLSRPEEFHRAAEELLTDPARRAAFGARGRERVREGYDSTVLAGRMHRLYQELQKKIPCAT